MEMPFLRSGWETTRCIVTQAQDSDLEAMASIFSGNAAAVRSQGVDCAPEHLASVLLHHEALPPNGDPSREHTFLIADKDSKETIGLLSVYWGYPTATTLYIGSLFFKRKWQRRGLGREIVESLEQHARDDGYGEARVAVGLKNRPALRFWVRLGYNRVTKITGEEAFGDASYADMELVKCFGPEGAAGSLESV